MTIAEYLTNEFAARQASGVINTGWPDIDDSLYRYNRVEMSQWITYGIPLGEEEMSTQITKVLFLTETREYFPRTELGKRLMMLRNRAIDSGMLLLSEDEVLEEVMRRRGELDYDKTHIY